VSFGFLGVAPSVIEVYYFVYIVVLIMKMSEAEGRFKQEIKVGF
jgi:hypothetical protein